MKVKSLNILLPVFAILSVMGGLFFSGSFNFSKPSLTLSDASSSNISIVARGTNGEEKIALYLNNTPVQFWDLTTSFQTYTYTPPQSVTINQLSVEFLNDRWEPQNGINYDVQINHIIVNGERYDSEHATTASTGSWDQENWCAPGNKQTEWLHCSGSFTYNIPTGTVVGVDVGGGSTVHAPARIFTPTENFVVEGSQVQLTFDTYGSPDRVRIYAGSSTKINVETGTTVSTSNYYETAKQPFDDARVMSPLTIDTLPQDGSVVYLTVATEKDGASLQRMVSFVSAQGDTPVEICGNDILEELEQCDDGNTINGDGCSASCTVENVVACGNGVLEGSEQCDDGNAVNGDGCSVLCVAEAVTFGDPSITSPSDGTELIGNDLSVSFDAPGSEEIRIQIGTTQTNGSLLDTGFSNTQTSPYVFSGLPRDGSNLFVTVTARNVGETRSHTIPFTSKQAPIFNGSLSMYDYKADPDFDKADLPSQEMRDHYDDWWAAYNTPRTYKGVEYTRGGNAYPDPAGKMVSLDFDGDSQGVYSIGRHFGFFTSALVDFLRSTGDPAVVEEIYHWAKETQKQYQDWDGRGYPYSQFNPSSANVSVQQHYGNDKVILDSQMAFGYVTMMAWALHENRGLDQRYGALADEWFTYWDEVHVPKWLYRTTVEGSYGGEVYVPPAELGLQNAINWKGAGSASDIQDQWSPFRPPNSGSDGLGWHTPEHPLQYPTRDYGHSLILSIVGHYNLGRYFLDTGKKPKGTWGYLDGNSSGQEHIDEAHRRLVFWNRGTGDGTGGPEADGSRTYWMQTSNSTEKMRVDSYAPNVDSALNYLYWTDHPLVQDEHMRSYALMYYDPDANPLDVIFYAIDNNISGSGSDTLCGAWFSDGRRNNSSKVSWGVRGAGYLARFDETGKIEQLLDERAVGDDPTRHRTGLGRPWQAINRPVCTFNTTLADQNHLSAQMLNASCRAGLCE